MRVVYVCTIFLLWTIVSSATTNKLTEIQSKPKGNQNVAIETPPVLPPGQRSKRQEGPGDQLTAVVGLSVQKAAGEDVYRTLKVAATRVVRERRSRRDHSLASPPQPNQVSNPSKPNEPIVVHHHHHHKIYVPAQATQKPRTSGPPLILTRTQEIFNLINYNARLARALKEEFAREINATILAGSAGGYIDSSLSQAVSRLIVVRENGITCNDVCDKSQGDSLGYGTIGICTPNFCQCDFNLGTYTRYDCPSDQVFDPVSLGCKSPFDVVLCNDDDIQEQQYGKQIGPVSAAPTYTLTGYSVTNAAPWSNSVTPSPYLLANSYGPFVDNNVDKQRAYGPPQSAQYGASLPQSFPAVQQQQFVTPAASPTHSFPAVQQQQQQFVTPAASPSQSVQTVQQQQQFVTPAPSPTAEWTSWMHSKIVKEILQLSPHEKEQLAKLVNLLANNQQILGQR